MIKATYRKKGFVGAYDSRKLSPPSSQWGSRQAWWPESSHHHQQEAESELGVTCHLRNLKASLQ